MIRGKHHDMQARPMPADSWVRESVFGNWFLSTDTWRKRVLAVAVADLEKLMGPRPDRFPSILDIGCGLGHSFRLLEERFHPDVLVGVDIDPKMIARARREAERCSCRLELHVGVASALGLPEASFDMVFCHQVLHHTSDQEGAVRELSRVLKPGGVLLFSESCRLFIRSLKVRLLFRHPLGVQRTAEEYVGMLRSAGFHLGPENVSTPNPWWSKPLLGIPESFLGRPRSHEDTLVNVVAWRPA